jgi:glutamate-1-semialdehyde 2,1-aminomutase
MTKRYQYSEKLLARALKSIPLGSQTFSKSKTQYPLGISPYFITKGSGSRVWDVDGNEYIDFINALAAINLGYNDPDVTKAIREQLQAGVIFSLPHPLEMQVAETMIEMIPCAEMVRFGKNGSDATSGAIRLARAYTKRDRIAVCGYHGWHDWYIGSTPRDLGVPESTRRLTHKFTYNNLGSLEKLFLDYPEQIAGVILEPMNAVYPENNFLENVRELTHHYGAVLIFDETITGFRYAKGGAQEYFGVTPDLASFGKGIANGHPLSAVTGKREIMALMEDIFFSFTFGGETLSLAAGLATMKKIQTHPVIETLKVRGQKLIAGIQEAIARYDVGHIFSLSGHPAWSFLLIQDVAPYSQWQIKTLCLQEMFARGILTLGTHNLSYAHDDTDIEKLLQVYNEIFPFLRSAIANYTLEKDLQCEPLEPLFKVR